MPRAWSKIQEAKGSSQWSVVSYPGPPLHRKDVKRKRGEVRQLGIRMASIESRLTSIERGIESINRKIWAGLIIMIGLLTKIAFF